MKAEVPDAVVWRRVQTDDTSEVGSCSFRFPVVKLALHDSVAIARCIFKFFLAPAILPRNKANGINYGT
jgi:hypothetical protein